jgi:hypothetical protein
MDEQLTLIDKMLIAKWRKLDAFEQHALMSAIKGDMTLLEALWDTSPQLRKTWDWLHEEHPAFQP